MKITITIDVPDNAQVEVTKPRPRELTVRDPVSSIDTALYVEEPVDLAAFQGCVLKCGDELMEVRSRRKEERPIENPSRLVPVNRGLAGTRATFHEPGTVCRILEPVFPDR